jgi:hypothetical protein
MKKSSWVLVSIVIAVFITCSFGADTGWQMMLGSPDKNEEANSVIVTAKGSYIIGGSV